MFKVSSAIRGFLLGFRVCCGVGDWGPHACWFSTLGLEAGLEAAWFGLF